MIKWLIILGTIYISLLFSLAFRSRRAHKSSDDFMMAGSNIGMVLGFMTFAATLFSTFTLQGMPDFFRTHGIGAWIFLAVSDGVMVFLVVWFGFHLRKKVAEKGFRGMGGLLSTIYENKWAGYVYFFGVFIFLVPYVAIQIRGVAIFLSAIFPAALPDWGWSLAIVVTLLIYSEIGGLKGIMYADFMQAIILMTAVWIIAITCLHFIGGVGSLFQQVQQSNPALLSIPGPKGLFNIQFLIASLLAILMVPVTQPQLSTRLVVMKDLNATHRMAVAVGVFAILVILPTCFIGMYGAIKYPGASPADFIANVLLFDQHVAVAAITVIGLVAAALSTSDSQIFALGSELRSLLKGEENVIMLCTRMAMIVFGICALIFAIVASDQLVLIARVSFAGTSMLAPMIFAAVLTKRAPNKLVIWATFGALLIFLSSVMKLIPTMVGAVRLDMGLLLLLGLITLISVLLQNNEI